MKMLDELNKLQIQINELKKQALADQHEWPADGDTYYSYGPAGIITEAFFLSDFYAHRDRNTINMCFKTREEAELSFQQALAYRMLWKLADGGNYQIRYSNKYKMYMADLFTDNYGTPKFSTIDKAQAAIITLGTDLLDTIFEQG